MVQYPSVASKVGVVDMSHQASGASNIAHSPISGTDNSREHAGP